MAYTNRIKIVFFISHFILSTIIECSTLPRYAHTSNLIDTNLYFLGGITTVSKSKFADFFYIDVFSPFQLSTSANTSSSISFKNLTNLFNISNHAFSTSCVDDTMIVVYGGQMFDVDDDSSLVYFINTELGLWNKSKVSGPSPGRRRDLMGVINSSREIYLFGGIDENQNMMKDMIVLDIFHLTWRKVNTTAPNPRASYAAILLNDGRILYIGGLSDKQNFVSMDQILTYDTVASTWNTITTVGRIPSVRMRHSAVLTNDDRIIIYGGFQNGSIPATPSLAVLEINKSMWLEIKENGIRPPNLQSHTSTLVGDLMIVAFGNVTKFQSLSEGPTSNIYILNTTNYTWITRFTPPFSSDDTDSEPRSLPIDLLHTNIILIIIIMILALTSFMVCVTVCVKLYKKQKRNRVVGIYRNSRG